MRNRFGRNRSAGDINFLGTMLSRRQTPAVLKAECMIKRRCIYISWPQSWFVRWLTMIRRKPS